MSVASQRRPFVEYPCITVDGWQVNVKTKVWEPVSAVGLVYAFAKPDWRISKIVVSPDGTRAAFVIVYSHNDVTEPADLFMVDVLTRRYQLIEKNLPMLHDQAQWEWSPDGKLLAFALIDREYRYRMTVTNVDGSIKHHVTLPVRGLIEGWTSAETLIISAEMGYSQSTVAPHEGERIYVFTTPDLRLAGIIEASATSNIFRPGRRENNAVWFLRGRSRIAYIQAGTTNQMMLLIADAQGHTMATYPISVKLEYPKMIESPDQRYLAIADFPFTTDSSLRGKIAGPGNLDLIDLAAGTVVNISSHASHWNHFPKFTVTWGLDSKRLYFVDEPTPLQMQFTVYVVSEKKTQVLVTGLAWDVIYNPKRTHAIFFDNHASSARRAGIIDLEGHTPPLILKDRLVETNTFPANWMPDGETVLLTDYTYVSAGYIYGELPSNLVVAQPSAGRREVYRHWDYIGGWTASNDGRYIAYSVFNSDIVPQADGQRQKHLMFLDRTFQRVAYLYTSERLTFRTNLLELAWSPDNSRMLLEDNGFYYIIMMDGAILNLGRHPAPGSSGSTDISWGSCDSTPVVG